jgi:single-stranded-DNA-specific exonuclease
MPPADYVVDPKREDDTYPCPGICGAYVAFKFIKGLLYGPFAATLPDYENIKEGRDELMSELTELAALATVADIMELTGENRELVKKLTDMIDDQAHKYSMLEAENRASQEYYIKK